MSVLAGCHNARNMVTIEEIQCPACGEIMEVFIRDGMIAADAICECCGYWTAAGEKEDALYDQR
ncbi:MAG: hypothetical protein LUF30_09590 [Lachnospiraceae bacterium]|nr:hypothetical protein [Lachnospiraceae bacterium]